MEFIPDFEQLRAFLNSLESGAQREYAESCGTTVGYLRKAMSAKERIAESTVLELERNSGGKVRCEKIRPDFDWEYLRSSGLTHTRRKRA